MDYKFDSENTLDYLSLHDCMCKKLFFKENQLVFNMEWMEVLDTHPLNPFKTAHRSDEGIIILNKPVLIDAKLIACGKNETNYVITNINDISFSNIEILKCDEKFNDGIFCAEFYIQLYDKKFLALEFTVKYLNSKIMWNNFEEESWFVNFDN